MPRLKSANFAKSRLAQDIDQDQNFMYVEDSSKFPEPPFRVVVNNEIIEVGGLNRESNIFTNLQRGLEGTTASFHAAGSFVENVFTAGTYEELEDLKGKKVARFVIGTFASGWTKNDVDYLCDGVDDQEEINAAIQALPVSGGEIIILDGTYNITAKINVNKSNISIKGNGNATILKRMWDSVPGVSVEGVITLNSVSNCKVENLRIDGNGSAYTSAYNYGIAISSGNNNTITGNTCNNNSGYGIYLFSAGNNIITSNICNNNERDGIHLNAISPSYNDNNVIAGNTCNNNGRYGISIIASRNNTITGNTCNNNNEHGISVTGSSTNNNTIAGNTCNNNRYGIDLGGSNNTATGNTCNNNTVGIYLTSSQNSTVTGNTCNDNAAGIYVALSSNNTITGNTCIRGTGQSSDYTSSQYTIRLAGSGNNYNLISSNNCMGKNVVIDGGTSNTSVNNKYN